MKIDLGTYGSTPAATTLSKLVGDYDNHHISKIGKIWGKFTEGVNAIEKSNLPCNIKEQTILLWKKSYLSKVDESEIPEMLKSYLKNMIVTRIKLVKYIEKL